MLEGPHPPLHSCLRSLLTCSPVSLQSLAQHSRLGKLLPTTPGQQLRSRFVPTQHEGWLPALEHATARAMLRAAERTLEETEARALTADERQRAERVLRVATEELALAGHRGALRELCRRAVAVAEGTSRWALGLRAHRVARGSHAPARGNAARGAWRACSAASTRWMPTPVSARCSCCPILRVGRWRRRRRPPGQRWMPRRWQSSRRTRRCTSCCCTRATSASGGWCVHACVCARLALLTLSACAVRARPVAAGAGAGAPVQPASDEQAAAARHPAAEAGV